MNKVKVAVAGCGSVSTQYLPCLKECPCVDVVGVCDIIESRYRERMAEFEVKNGFASVDAMLAGVDFDFMVDLTSMPAHYEVNKKGLQAGKHVWSEKPLAPDYPKAQELLDLATAKGVWLWGAPNAVLSPQFAHMAQTLAKGEIGDVHAAHACYGHGGPSWGPEFYGKGGGCIGDLAVYNVTTLTGLLGPAKGVMAMTGIVIPEREIERQAIKVEAEDNAMILIDHGNAVFSHIQTGFVYNVHFDDHTIELIGSRGAMTLLGWDWAPKGVNVRLANEHEWRTRCTSKQGYGWQNGAVYAAECLAEGKPGIMTAEHAVHAAEIMAAAHESSRTGHRIAIQSTFPWPIIK